MSSIKLTFGLRDNALVDIGQVDSGLACGCTCPHCNAPLVAKKGKRNEHHFAHYKSQPCAHAVETALHLAAKDILDQARVIQLPNVKVSFSSYKPDLILIPANHYPIQALRIEQREAGLVPDLIATIEGQEVWIEIHVTHRVDDEKLERIRNLGVSVIEIDLSRTPRNLTCDQLTEILIHDIENKRWLHNAEVSRKYDEILSQCREMPVIRRRLALHVDYCPIRARVWRGKPYANMIDDCWYCEHCIDTPDGNRTILCNGHLPTNQPNTISNNPTPK